MRITGEAVVADHPVGDEVTRPGGDVVHGHFDAQGLDLRHVQLGVALERDTVDRALPGDGDIDGVEEPEHFPEPAAQPKKDEAVPPLGAFGLIGKTERRQRRGRAADDLGIGVGDAEYPLAVAALGVEDPRQEALLPVRRGRLGPGDQVPDRFHRASGGHVYRPHGLPLPMSFGEGALRRHDAEGAQAAAGPAQCLRVHQREAELVTFSSCVVVAGQVGIAANHAAEVATPVIDGVLGPFREPAHPHQLVVDGQERPLQRTLLRAGHVLPAPLGEEAVVTAGDQLGPVRQRDPVGGLDRGPVREDGRDRVPSVETAADGAVDRVADAYVRQGFGASIRHQGGRLTCLAVGTCMLATSVGVDRPAEGHPGGRRDPVDDGLGLDLVEGHAAEARRVEGAGHRAPVEQCPRLGPRLFSAVLAAAAVVLSSSEDVTRAVVG